MCIKSIPAYEDSKGNMFKTERAAIESEIGIVTGFVADDVLTIIGKASPLVPLLQRVLAIAPPKPKAEAPSAEPERTPEQRYERRAALLGRLQNWAQRLDIQGDVKSLAFITSGGYKDLKDINDRATDEDIEKMHSELDEKEVA